MRELTLELKELADVAANWGFQMLMPSKAPEMPTEPRPSKSMEGKSSAKTDVVKSRATRATRRRSIGRATAGLAISLASLDGRSQKRGS